MQSGAGTYSKSTSQVELQLNDEFRDTLEDTKTFSGSNWGIRRASFVGVRVWTYFCAPAS